MISEGTRIEVLSVHAQSHMLGLSAAVPHLNTISHFEACGPVPARVFKFALRSYAAAAGLELPLGGKSGMLSGHLSVTL
jgi:hypothetical protein